MPEPSVSIRRYLLFGKALITKNCPIYVHYGITHRCNLRCRMCNLWQSGKKEEELSLEQLEELAEILVQIGTIQLSIGGGEPFVRPDLPEVVRTFLNRGIGVRVLTNGVAAEEDQVKAIAAAGLTDISVSLDTLSPEKQDAICQRPGAHRHILENLCLFSKHLPAKGSILLLNTVVSPMNLAELPDLAEFADEIGYYISFVPVQLSKPEGEVRAVASYDEEMDFDPSMAGNIDAVYDKLIAMKQEGKRILNSSRFLLDSKEFLKTGKASWRCDAGALYFSVSPTGHFSICHRFEDTDTVPYDEFLEYLAGPDFERERDALVRGCSGCQRPCWAEVTNLVRDRKSLFEMVRVRRSAGRPRPSLELSELLSRVQAAESSAV